MLEKAWGGEGNLSQKGSLPSPHSHPILSKTFALIESLFTDFPVFQEKELRLFFYLVKAMERQEERERKRKPLSGKFGRGLVFIIKVKLLQLAQGLDDGIQLTAHGVDTFVFVFRIVVLDGLFRRKDQIGQRSEGKIGGHASQRMQFIMSRLAITGTQGITIRPAASPYDAANFASNFR